ncbi:MAG: hypothetical protein ACOYN0_16070 [Phycisphaerales bacterium]
MNSNVLKAGAAVAMLGVSAWFVLGRMNEPEPGEMSFFYDLSEKRIYKAPKDSILPHEGVGGAAGDGYRAFVIAPKGEADKPESRKAAYIESYTPEFAGRLKAYAASLKDQSLPRVTLSREETWKGTLVRRLSEEAWHEQSSPAGEDIRREWMNPGPDGRAWVVCEPR